MKRPRFWLFVTILTFVCSSSMLVSCNKDDSNPEVKPVAKEYFTLWNNCEALMALQNFVKDVTNPSSPNFISEEDRIATFDIIRRLTMCMKQHRPSATLFATAKRCPTIST